MIEGRKHPERKNLKKSARKYLQRATRKDLPPPHFHT
jgi:hypothetical protein